MKHLLVVAWCIGIYIVVEIFQYNGWYPKDSMFYAVNSLWSLLIIVAINAIERSVAVFLVSLLNVGHIMLNLVACYEYMTLITPYGFVYKHYPVILHTLNFAELAVLIMGAPRARMDRNRTKLGRLRFYQSTTMFRGSSIN